MEQSKIIDTLETYQEELDNRCLYKETRIPFLHDAFSLSLPFHSRAPAPKSSSFPPQESTQPCPDLEGKASGWPPPLRRRTSPSFGRPGIWRKESLTGF